MKTLLLTLSALLLPLAGFAAAPAAQAPQIALKEDLVKYAPFGNVLVYTAKPKPEHVMIFISGDGGFDKPFINMIHTVATPDMMVIAVDINTYLKNMGQRKGACMYAAADLEGLSQYVQGRYNYTSYVLPVISGYSSGATMAYTSLVQGPANTFAGVMSMGFCADLPSPKPFCKGSSLTYAPTKVKDKTSKFTKSYLYGKVSETVAPFVTLQGGTDQVCPQDKAKDFFKDIKNTSVIELPKVGHGFLVGENWQKEYQQALQAILAKQKKSDDAVIKPQSLKDLPLIENALPSPQGKPLALIMTGDGGWAGIDREIGSVLNQDGINVVGLNSLQYFWSKKTPDVMGKDLSRILAWYQAAWKPSSILLIGYSRGADSLPFMINRLPQSQQAAVSTIALLGAAHKASFAFHVSDWLTSSARADDQPIKPEAIKLPLAARKLCFYGEDETADSLCPTLDAKAFTIIKTPGGHHFGGDYTKLAETILGR